MPGALVRDEVSCGVGEKQLLPERTRGQDDSTGQLWQLCPWPTSSIPSCLPGTPWVSGDICASLSVSPCTAGASLACTLQIQELLQTSAPLLGGGLP